MIRKIIRGIINLIKENKKNINLRRRTLYATFYKYLKINSKMILYESYFGRGMLCNPYAIFIEMLSNPIYHNYIHVWVVDRLADHQDLIREYSEYPNVKFVQYQSREYLWHLCRAKYLINNVTFPSYFTKKEGQIYVNTWHGIPLKHLGYDMPNGIREVSNTVRNFLQADYLISASPFLTDVYKNAFKMDNLYEGKIVEAGYPRLDILYHFSREEILEKLAHKGMKIDAAKKIILYAPTWKGSTYGKANEDVECYYQFKEELEKQIDTEQYQILIKVHQRVYELSKDKLDGSFCVPATIDANEVLAVTDILISDFSSIYYDYLATGRPILFYITDVEQYSEERGLYLGIDDLPGPHTDSVEKLGQYLNDVETVSAKYSAKYKEAQKENCVYSDGTISKNVVEAIFEGKEDNTIRLAHKKEKLFISRGSMLVNGITSACISLLNFIDYDKYDVTLMIAKNNKGEVEDVLDRINKNVRVLYRNTTLNLTFVEQLQKKYREHIKRKVLITKDMQREVKRCYGEITFDYLIDFEGYNLFYAILLLNMSGKEKSIWQHNDMVAEKELKFSWLENIFMIYYAFEHVISCSYEIMQVNREKLAGKYCDYDKFGYASNIVDAENIRNSIGNEHRALYNGKNYVAVEEKGSEHYKSVKLIPCCESAEKYRFVTVGRMSPEKNQMALISAFAKLQQEIPTAVLYILGDGPLKKQTAKYISKLHLNDHVIMTGNIANPYVVMKQCDCFILPSLHEGQPMSIHEARVLGLPIIVSDFSSVGGSVIENGQLVIGTDEDAIYEGIKAYINGKVPQNYVFDAEKYNEKAYREFEAAIRG